MLPPQSIVREIEAIEVFAISARLATITVPVRLLLGTERPTYFRPAAEAIAAQLANAEIVPLAGQAHMAISDDPDQFVKPCWASTDDHLLGAAPLAEVGQQFLHH